MGFGIISSVNTAQLKIFVDCGEGWHTEYGDVLKFLNVPYVKAWFRLPSEKHTADLYLNGILANQAFNIKVSGKQFEFDMKMDAALFKQPFTIQLEVFKP